jgi:hypothetical protein
MDPAVPGGASSSLIFALVASLIFLVNFLLSPVRLDVERIDTMTPDIWWSYGVLAIEPSPSAPFRPTDLGNRIHHRLAETPLARLLLTR